MKKIICELCEGMEFTKDGGMFICNSCGTKYTAEEARALMREVDGDASVSAGAPVSAAPTGNVNQQQLDNVLLLATSAYEADNKAEAENYCNQAIVLDATCYKAWMLKGKAVGWQSKIDNLRIEEAAHSFCKAIDFAPEEEKEELKKEAVEEIRSLGIALITLRKNRFSSSPDSKELKGFTSDKAVVLKSVLVLLSHGNIVSMPEGFLEEVASLMNQAGVAALNMARKAWSKVEHPSEKDFDTYLGWNVNISQVFREAIETSDEDEEADIVRYKNLIISLEEPMDVDACSYKREWISWKSEYDWVREYSLSESAKQSRRKEVAECKAKIAAIEKKKKEKAEAAKKAAEEEKKKRIEAYWAAHADEKAKLDAEKKELTEKERSLKTEIANLDKQINNAQPSGAVPSEIETGRMIAKIQELETRRAGLGLFAGKEKKQIGEEIASIQAKIESLKGNIAAEKKLRSDEANKALAPIKAKKNELEKQLKEATNRLSAINSKLTKDPEGK